jgi:hypothetical protein
LYLYFVVEAQPSIFYRTIAHFQLPRGPLKRQLSMSHPISKYPPIIGTVVSEFAVLSVRLGLMISFWLASTSMQSQFIYIE